MLRSLWTAASGMTAQQTNVDTIANNLANVNTTGYKSETAEFKSLLYQNLQSKTTSANGDQKPVSAQVGLGVRNSSITSHYTQGAFLTSDSNTAYAITGSGFFGIQGTDGNTYYTRNGDFVLGRTEDGLMLCTTEGNAVLGTDGNPITFDADYDTAQITVDEYGNFYYPDDTNNPVATGQQIGLFQFSNPSGLEKTTSSLLRETDASGAATNEGNGETVTRSKIKSGALEASNVNVATEMVNLITAQRAYELNSKAIQASDDMLSQANNLKR